MGLLGDWLKSKNMKDPVRGTLQVTASTMPPDSATSGNFAINGIVSASGIAPTAVEHQGMARTRKWPRAGQSLPVTVDRADPTRIRIDWDEVPDSWDTARRTAEQLAQSMRGQPPSGTGDAGPASAATFGPGSYVFQTGTSTSIDATNVPGLREEILRIVSTNSHDPAAVQRLIQAKLVERGVLNPDGSPGRAAAGTPAGMTTGSPAVYPPGQPVAPSQDSETADPATRLRTLQKLHRDGLVTDEEYARLRTQILREL